MGVQTEITVEECTQLVSSLTPSIIGRELLLRLALTHSYYVRTFSTPPGQGTMGHAQLRRLWSARVRRQCTTCPNSCIRVFTYYYYIINRYY
jgi:hypothetical protein